MSHPTGTVVKMVLGFLILLFVSFSLFKRGAFFLLPLLILFFIWLWRNKGSGSGFGPPEDPADWWKKPKSE